MQAFRIIVLALLLPVITRAQNAVITGKISAADTKAPLAHANVFLSNSSFGTSTASDGTFTLSGLKPGQYTIVVSTVGYEDKIQNIAVNNSAVKLDIELSPKVIQLKEVKISILSKSDRKQALEQFKQDFIGTDENAHDCKIINPDVLNFSYHQNKTVLEAYTDEFLIVENNALGYRIKFLVKSFKSSLLTGDVVYSGSEVFEDMAARESKKIKWYKKRDEAYYGSAMHFYRSLYKDSVEEAGFKIYRLSRMLNPKRPPEEVIAQNLDKARAAKDDSYLHWTNVALLSRYTNQKLTSKPWKTSDIVQKTDNPGLFKLSFPDCLYVVYTKKWESGYYKDLYHAPYNLNYATTVISFGGTNQDLLFDKNGTIISDSPLYEGNWSQSRLSTTLPVDYVPYGKQP